MMVIQPVSNSMSVRAKISIMYYSGVIGGQFRFHGGNPEAVITGAKY